MSITNIVISVIMLFTLPLLLAKVYERLDKELGIQISKKDIITFAIVAICVGIGINLVDYNTLEIIHLSIILSYLFYMSYTDQKTKLLYSSISFGMLILEAILVVVKFNQLNINTFTWTIILISVILFVFSIFKGIGQGDVLIYSVLCLYYIQIRSIPTLSMLLNIIITNVMFIISAVVYKLYRKIRYKESSKGESLPLTIYIAISTVICSILLI